MSRWAKVGIVSAGWLLAIVAGGVAGYLYNVRVSAYPYDTSGGMYAFGESMAALGAFLVVGLVPALLMLWWLRGHQRIWQAIALVSLGFACVGLLAVLLPLVTRNAPGGPWMVLFSLLGLAQLLGVPLWTVAFTLFAWLAPNRPARRLLVTAIGVELVIGVCAAIHWFVPSPPF